MNYNISFLRNLAIISIVIHHTVCMYCGWPPNTGLSSAPEWSMVVSGLAVNLGLGTFTFISGYVMYYQSKKNENFTAFFKKKFIRILLPCFIWAACYQLLFPQYMNVGKAFWPSCINGTPLWYLPMIFLCILTGSLMFYTKHPLALMLVCWISAKILGAITHFNTLHMFFLYFPIFITGYLCCAYDVASKIRHNRFICNIVYGGVAILIIPVYYINTKYFGPLLMILLALFTFFCVTIFRNEQKMGIIEKLVSKQSFTIYLLHQFVINIFLYYKIPHKLSFETAVGLTFTAAFVLPCIAGLCYDYINERIRSR